MRRILRHVCAGDGVGRDGTYRWKRISGRGQGEAVLAVENDEREMGKVLRYPGDAQIAGGDGSGHCWAEWIKLDRVFAHEQVSKYLALDLLGYAMER